jgi:hypothetical protein
MKRARITLAALAAALFMASAGSAAALDFGLNASAHSFGSADYAKAGILPGLYARGGAIVGVLRRLELEPYAVVELAPDTLRGCMLGADATLGLLGSRIDGYFNVFLSLGYARSFDFAHPSAGGRNYLSLRLTPLAIGCTQYGRRDRLFTPGILYELEGRSWTFTFNVLGFDFFSRGTGSERL